jgi:hypothetical protein
MEIQRQRTSIGGIFIAGQIKAQAFPSGEQFLAPFFKRSQSLFAFICNIARSGIEKRPDGIL